MVERIDMTLGCDNKSRKSYKSKRKSENLIVKTKKLRK